LDVRDDFFTISANDFKNTISCSFNEIRERKFDKYFWPGNPVMRSFYAEVIRQFVAYEGSKQIIDINTPCFMFPENITKFRTSNNLSTRKMVPIGKDIF